MNLRQSFRRARTIPLPNYPDATKIWHYHVACPACHPDRLEALHHTDAVPTRAEAFRLQASLSGGIHGDDAGHHHVLLGCAGAHCRIHSLSPD